MKNQIILNGENFTIDIIRKQNIKHIYLKITEPYKVQIRTNTWISEKYILDFVEKKSHWIYKNHKNRPLKVSNEDEMLYLGKLYKRTEILDLNQDIEKFYKTKAIETITPIVEKFSDIMSLYPLQLKFRKNKSRWGSCSSKNNINLNTELIKYDVRFIEYVVVHELAHIKHKNHKKEFWDLVEKYVPDYKYRRKLYQQT